MLSLAGSLGNQIAVQIGIDNLMSSRVTGSLAILLTRPVQWTCENC